VQCREAAIQKFNAPNSECFIFLLSIRAAGRGLNLQSSDTVVIYDPDPNPKNEEQVRRGIQNMTLVLPSLEQTRKHVVMGTT